MRENHEGARKEKIQRLQTERCVFAFFACPKASPKDSFWGEFHSGERGKKLLVNDIGLLIFILST